MHIMNTLLIFMFLLVLHFVPSVTVASQEVIWEQVPLRSKAQEIAGIQGGEGLQQVQAIAYSNSNPAIVYLSTDTSRVWKSINSGLTWVPTNSGFGAHGARSVIVDPINPNIVFAAGFGGRYVEDEKKVSTHLQGIYRTLDGGETWSLVFKAEFYKQASKGSLFAYDKSVVDSNATQILYCGTYKDGLLRSNDGGSTWSCIGLEGLQITDIEKDHENEGALWIATEKGLFRLLDGKTLRVGLDLPNWPRSIAISKHRPDIIYAALGESGVYKSEDFGLTFNKCTIQMPAHIVYSDVAVSRSNVNIVYLRCDKVGIPPLYSQDGGNTWHISINTDIGNLLENEGFYFSSPYAVHPNLEKVAITSSNGKARILKTVDGGKTWRYSGSGFTGAHVEDIEFYGPGKMIFALTDFGLWRSEDNGASFRQLPIKRMFGSLSSSSVAVKNNTIVASIGTWNEKGLAIGRNGGKAWTYFSKLKGKYKFISFHPDNDNLIYAGSYRSRDNGKSWEKIDYGLRGMHPENGDIVYGFKPIDRKSCYLMKSSDQGQSWNQHICPFNEKDVQDFEVRQDGMLFVATSSGLRIFDGKSWQKRNGRHGLKKDAAGLCYVSSVEFDPDDKNRLFLTRRAPGYGKSNGIYLSTDKGENWKNISANIGSQSSATTVKVDPFSGCIYIGTYQGTWRYTPKKSMELNNSENTCRK